MEKKNTMSLVIATTMIMLLISANMESVNSQLGPGDCYDGCSTGCVSYFPDQRRMSRCDQKCSIRCSPERQANGNSK